MKEIYKPFSDEEISYKISEMLKTNDINAEVEVIFQTIDGLKKACPKIMGDWYFSGIIQHQVVQGCEQSFCEFCREKNKRAY